jgi:uncharacterized protein YecE (DUF72 family)
MEGLVFVGTSGWIYKEWAGTFYPKKLSKSGELEFYATKFNTVEINATFYRLPLETMVQGWYKRSPANFIFAAKGSRFLTHIKRLKGTRESIKKYFDRVKLLKEKCGPILWQLPPNLKYDSKLLDGFLKKLPKRYRHAVEYRHPSWYEHEESFGILRKYNMAHVSVSSLKMPMNLTMTTDFTYIRFHGLEGGPYHDYTTDELKPWAKHCREQVAKGFPIYAYFNNDLNHRAPLNAVAFREMVKGK